MRNIGSGPGRVLIETIDAFEHLAISPEERASALASAIAGAALTYHSQRSLGYLAAIRAWAMPIALEILPPPPEAAPHPTIEQIEEATELLLGGLEELVDALGEEGSSTEDRLIIEIALFARLLGRHDASTVLSILHGVTAGLQRPGFVRGNLIEVALNNAKRVTRDGVLDDMPVMGFA